MLAVEPFINSSSLVGNLPVNPYTGGDDAMPLILARYQSAGSGEGTNRWAYIDGIVVPWPQAVTPSS